MNGLPTLPFTRALWCARPYRPPRPSCCATTLAAAALGLALLALHSVARSAEGPAGDSADSLRTPLTAEAFTEAVITRNASLEAMRQTVVAATARIKPAGALEDPMLSVSAAPRTFGSAMGAMGDVEISQALPWWGTLDARIQVARAEADAAAHDVEALRLRVAALARGAFSDWVFVHRALDINAANQTLLDELRNIARVRYATGQAPQQDVLQADVARTMLRQQRFELERQRTVMQARMNALLDRTPQQVMPQPAALPDVMALPAEELLAERALAHPQLRQLQAEGNAAQAREHLEEKERYPKFGVSAGYNNMWSEPAQRPMVGFSVTLPIDQEKYRSAIDAARAQARRSASALEDQRASVMADLSVAYASTREAAQSLALYHDELVPLARTTLEVTRSEYASGRGDFLNVLTAEQHRLDTELGLARMQSEYYQRLAQLDQASAGGLLAQPGSVYVPSQAPGRQMSEGENR
jgi:cobalt-zinc-cadmium efflux system outer membrane protein